MTAHPLARRWTREEYHKAAELGLFRPEERLELLDGEVVRKMSPQSRPHAWSVARAAEILRAAFGAGFHVREEKPLALDEDNEPEPDVVVVAGELRDTPDHPTPENAALVLEVSQTTLTFDQNQKAAVYARHSIADYWVLNLPERRLEVRRDPSSLGDNTYGYRTLQLFLPGMTVAPLAAPHLAIPIDDLLPIQAASA